MVFGAWTLEFFGVWCFWMLFRARHFTSTFPRPALIMGVVNVTPDSFSDGGQFLDADRAVAHGRELMEQGAEILDVGGESTRPGAVPVSETEELRRVIPVVEKLAGRVKVPVSIDNPSRLKAELQTEEMWQIVAEAGAGYVCMHMQGTPQTMQANPVYADVVTEVGDFFRERLRRLNACGVKSDQVVLDPGIGFGKTLEHNLQLLARLRSFTNIQRPLLLGVSRKGFIGKLLGPDVTARLPASLACACLAVEAGVQIIRAHDVAETVQAVRMTEAMLARRGAA